MLIFVSIRDVALLVLLHKKLLKQGGMSTKQEKQLLIIGTTLWYLVRVCEYVSLRTNVVIWAFRVISSTSGTREAEKVGAFVKWHATKTIQCAKSGQQPAFPQGYLRRSCTLGMAPARRRGTRVSNRGENWNARSHSQPNLQRRDQRIEPLHGVDLSTMPLPHSIHIAYIYMLVQRERSVQGEAPVCVSMSIAGPKPTCRSWLPLL